MIYFEIGKKGVTERLEGNGLDLLTELMLVIKAFKEEDFPRELIDSTVDFVYGHLNQTNDEKNHPEKDLRRDPQIDPKIAESVERVFENLFGDIFKDE
jgi:hypothetical protein